MTEEQQKWELLLAAIGETRMDQAGVNDDWSMRDVIAHLTGWQRWLVTRLQAAEGGQPEPPPPWPADLTSEDDSNTWVYESNRQRTIRHVLNDAHDVHEQLLAVLQALPEDCRIESIEAKFHVIWVNDQRFAVGEFFHHFHDDHAADVRAWLGGVAQGA
ncbi:MAG: ClbS/DfsB family four-helix bundle protein [Chloroflexi bacterium]|nr:ClbS/DfsB family four-helix bundle protein [Chloroflexota bacterium]